LVGFDKQLKRRQEIDELLDKLNTEKNAIDQQVKAYMQDAEIAEDSSFIVSWKNVISNKIDTAKLKLEMPDIYRQFLKPSSSRRFVVKTV
jgi:Phage-related protein, predicted endonuclease